MKIFHIADLHLGKRVNEFLMIDEQRYILDQIITKVKLEKPDAIILAGDIYDRSIPSNESVQLFDNFLETLKDLDLKVYIIAGNHDSKERLAFASSILRDQNFFIEGDYKGEIFVDRNDEVD
ncbi:MAG TPA: exonuclease subunit SbcD, partial [Erysipelothrix sp.]|nr:exonuclease subunit SbcD [Erysipelothrix sp.]